MLFPRPNFWTRYKMIKRVMWCFHCFHISYNTLNRNVQINHDNEKAKMIKRVERKRSFDRTELLSFFTSVLSIKTVSAFYGVVFNKNKEEAFALYKFIQSIGYAMAYGYGNHLCVRTKLMIILVFLAIGVMLYSYLHYKERSINKEEKQLQSEMKELASGEWYD